MLDDVTLTEEVPIFPARTTLALPIFSMVSLDCLNQPSFNLIRRVLLRFCCAGHPSLKMASVAKTDEVLFSCGVFSRRKDIKIKIPFLTRTYLTLSCFLG